MDGERVIPRVRPGAFRGTMPWEEDLPPPPPKDIVLPNGHVIRRDRPKPKPLAEPERRWLGLPPTAPGAHLSGLDALRIPDPRGYISGDWHKSGHWSYIAVVDGPIVTADTVAATSIEALQVTVSGAIESASAGISDLTVGRCSGC